MGAHDSGAALWTHGITLLGVGIGVVFHFIVPGLDMEGRRAVSVGHTHTQKKNTHTDRQTVGSVTGHPGTTGKREISEGAARCFGET